MDLQNIHYITCSNEVSYKKLAEGFILDLVWLEAEVIIVYDSHKRSPYGIRNSCDLWQLSSVRDPVIHGMPFKQIL